MLGRVLLVAAGCFGAGALLMLEQRRAGAKHSSTTRTAWRKYGTYAALIAGALGVAWAGSLAYAVGVLAVIAVSMSEFERGARGEGWKEGETGNGIGNGVGIGIGVAIGIAALAAGVWALYAATVAAMLGTLAAGALATEPKTGVARAAWAVTGLAAVAAPGAHLLLIAGAPERFARFAFLFLVVWGGDAFAELVGRRWPAGRGVFAASPGKTASGLVGGVAAALAIALAMRFTLPGWPLPYLALLGVAVGIAGALGDLLASGMKRAFGIKDFGARLGDHGGVLDRFDSLLFAAAPFYWLTRGLAP